VGIDAVRPRHNPHAAVGPRGRLLASIGRRAPARRHALRPIIRYFCSPNPRSSAGVRGGTCSRGARRVGPFQLPAIATWTAPRSFARTGSSGVLRQACESPPWLAGALPRRQRDRRAARPAVIRPFSSCLPVGVVIRARGTWQHRVSSRGFDARVPRRGRGGGAAAWLELIGLAYGSSRGAPHRRAPRGPSPVLRFANHSGSAPASPNPGTNGGWRDASRRHAPLSPLARAVDRDVRRDARRVRCRRGVHQAGGRRGRLAAPSVWYRPYALERALGVTAGTCVVLLRVLTRGLPPAGSPRRVVHTSAWRSAPSGLAVSSTCADCDRENHYRYGSLAGRRHSSRGHYAAASPRVADRAGTRHRMPAGPRPTRRRAGPLTPFRSTADCYKGRDRPAWRPSHAYRLHRSCPTSSPGLRLRPIPSGAGEDQSRRCSAPRLRHRRMPTGAGNSLTIPIPARILCGTGSIVSPTHLAHEGPCRGARAEQALRHGLNSRPRLETRPRSPHGFAPSDTRLVYFAPEWPRGRVSSALGRSALALVGGGRAPCISEWANRFRRYRRSAAQARARRRADLRSRDRHTPCTSATHPPSSASEPDGLFTNVLLHKF